MTHKFTLNAGSSGRPVVLATVHDKLDRLPGDISWSIEIKPKRRQRTDRQNAALFGLAYPLISEHLGQPVSVVHDIFCGMFFGTIDVDVLGQYHSRPFRTTTRNEQGERDVIPSAMFADFYEMVQRVAAENDVHIPDPDPLYNDGRFKR